MTDTGPPLGGATCATAICQDLTTHGLSLAYGGLPVLDRIDLHLRACRITAIVGPSGCGKSSLLTCLNRLDEETPAARLSGRVRWGAHDLLDRTLDRIWLRRRIGMLFQRPTPFPLSIARNLDLPLREHGFGSRRERRARVERALHSVGLWSEVADRLHRPAHELSGGQQQRLCLARTLALEPEVILMDEPCSALDPLSARTIEELIASLRGFYTVVLVTHDLQQAWRLADEVVLLWPEERGSRVLARGTSREEMLASTALPPLARDYLGAAPSPPAQAARLPI